MLPIIYIFVGGILPTILWLKFWLREDSHEEPRGLIAKTFLGGIVAVIISAFLQKIISLYIVDYTKSSLLLWALIEELTKFLVVYFYIRSCLLLLRYLPYILDYIQLYIPNHQESHRLIQKYLLRLLSAIHKRK